MLSHVRRSHHPWWWAGVVVCVALVISGLSLIVSARGSGPAPLPRSGLAMSPTVQDRPAQPPSTIARSAAEPSDRYHAAAAMPTTLATVPSDGGVTTATERIPRSETLVRRISRAPATSPSGTPAPASVNDDPTRPPSLPPHTIGIPAEAVTAPITGACRLSDGVLYPPADVHQTCWWGQNPASVPKGSVSVITSHVNYVGQGWGALSRIASLGAGDRVYITGAATRTTVWVVVDTRAYSKAGLPPTVFTDAVDGAPTLRLITCGGQLDPQTRSYRDNVVTTLVPAQQG